MRALAPTTPDEVVDAVRSHERVIAHGRLTKHPLVGDVPGTGAARLDMTGVAGVTEYDPGEFTFSALAGTPVADIEALLGENGQRMPWDPPLGEAGATLGGTLAAGVNGPVRLRYGGLRDFVIGARFVDGTGHLVRAGGKVVKNAAGFDLPRLLVGSAGRLGVITELTFKVFPAPQAWRTLRVACTGLRDALEVMAALGRQPLELEALDLEPPATLVIRVAGDAESLPAHAERVARATERPVEELSAPEEPEHWRRQRAFAWVPPEHWLVKVPLAATRLPALEDTLARHDLPRRYAVAANVAWLAWPSDRPVDELDLAGLAGLVVRGPASRTVAPWLGPAPRHAAPFAAHVKRALDPEGRFPSLMGPAERGSAAILAPA